MNHIREIQNFGELMADWVGHGLRPVDKHTAQTRADICLACPMHNRETVWEKFTKPVALWIRNQIQIKNRMKLRVDGEKSLGTCGVCHCVMRLKIWTPIKIVNDHTMGSKFPDNCWIAKENQ